MASEIDLGLGRHRGDSSATARGLAPISLDGRVCPTLAIARRPAPSSRRDGCRCAIFAIAGRLPPRGHRRDLRGPRAGRLVLPGPGGPSPGGSLVGHRLIRRGFRGAVNRARGPVILGRPRVADDMAVATDMRCRLAAGLGLVSLAACHVQVESQTLRAVSTERIVHPEGAIAHRATLVAGDDGRLRFVEPLECPTEEIVHQHATIETATRPNLAAFTVGVIAAAAGGVMLTTGLFARQPATSPFTYVGLAGAGLGLPLVIGPWLGDRVDVRDGGDPDAVRQPGPSQPCGERAMAARSATLDAAGVEIRGAVGPDGGFAISPYQWIDAYRVASAAPSEITAVVDGAGGPRTVAAVLEPRWLAAHAADFLAHADFDPQVQPLRLVPGLVAGALAVRLVTDADGAAVGAAVHVVLPLRNTGPGDAWAVRGQITAPGAPAIDGRMIYVGKLARGAAVSRELVIPVAPRAAAALRGQIVELSVELRDGHDTAPSTPVRFRGVLAEAPR